MSWTLISRSAHRKRSGSFLRAMKMETDCRIVVADNGRLWIDGDLKTY